MEQGKLEKLRQCYHRRTPFFSRWQQQGAARELAADHSLEAVRVMAEAVATNPSAAALGILLAALEQLDDPAQIEAVCGFWAVSRHPALADLLARHGWQATGSAELKVLTRLKFGPEDSLRDEAPEILEPLLRACTDVDEEIARRARTCLVNLTRRETIDALCRRWVEQRDPQLALAIRAARYVAGDPPEVRVWSALWAGRPELLEEAGSAAVPALREAARHRDVALSALAVAAIKQLRLPEARDAVCRLAVFQDDALAREIAQTGQFVPQDTLLRALFYFFTEQWPAYDSLDFDRRLLGEVCETADSRLRARIAAKARRSGRADLVSVIIAQRQERRLHELAEEDWEGIFITLRESEAWPELWRLALAAPPPWGARFVRHLQAARWQPEPPEQRTFFSELLQWVEPLVTETPTADNARLAVAPLPGLGCLTRSQAVLTGHSSQINCAALSADGKTAVSGGNDKMVMVWDLAQGALRFKMDSHGEWISQLAFSPDQALLASASGDRSLLLWHWAEGKRIQRLSGHGADVRCLAFCGAHRVLASGGDDKTVRLWRLPDGQALRTLFGHSDIISGLALSPDACWLASASYDHTVRLWRMPNGEPGAVLSGHQGLINCLAFSPVEMLLASGGKDRTLLLWSLPNGEKLKRLKGHKDDVTCLAITPDGRWLASGSWDNTVRLWRLPGGDPVAILGSTGTMDGHTGWVTCLAISPDGQLLASGSLDHTIRLWTLPAGEPVAVLEGHQDRLSCLAFTPDGHALVSASWDGAVRVWTSELRRLWQTPVGKCSWDDLTMAQQALRNPQLLPAERQWLQFMAEMLRWRHRHDIQIQESTRLEVGEFDIEIEG